MRRDEERLQDMLEAAREAVNLLGGRSADDLRSDRTLSLALLKLIEIVGEAAGSVTAAKRGALPGIPWNEAIATRNRLIHGYFSIDVQIVADTVRLDFPPLIAALEEATA